MYTDHTHPEAFIDLEKREPHIKLRLTLECPTCKGHGMWHLHRYAYPNHPGRHPSQQHFSQTCKTCWGYGYVDPSRPACEHEWSARETIGKSLHRTTCSKCGETVTIDSGD